MTADHALYVWSAYGATALVVATLIGRALIDHRAQRRALARLDDEDAGSGNPIRE